MDFIISHYLAGALITFLICFIHFCWHIDELNEASVCLHGLISGLSVIIWPIGLPMVIIVSIIEIIRK